MRVSTRLKSRVLGVRCVPESLKAFKFVALSSGTRTEKRRNTIHRHGERCSSKPPLLPAGQGDGKAVSSRGAGFSQGFRGEGA